MINCLTFFANVLTLCGYILSILSLWDLFALFYWPWDFELSNNCFSVHVWISQIHWISVDQKKSVKGKLQLSYAQSFIQSNHKYASSPVPLQTFQLSSTPYFKHFNPQTLQQSNPQKYSEEYKDRMRCLFV